MRIEPDDEVYRVRTVWHGPQGITLPWTARYLSYGMWLGTFLSVLLVEALTPINVGIPPVWEVSLTTLVTYGVMSVVDDERPIRAQLMTLRAELVAPRPAKPVRVRLDASTVTVGPLREFPDETPYVPREVPVVPDYGAAERKAAWDQALGDVGE